MIGIIMKFWDLSNEDIQSCIELACDGVNIHIQDTQSESGAFIDLNKQKTAEVIHKVMYAITEAVQNNPVAVNQLESNQACQFRLHLQVLL